MRRSKFTEATFYRWKKQYEDLGQITNSTAST
jgi:hypothetical protein